jgi:hypothetical protein
MLDEPFSRAWNKQMSGSEWFTRGWTLQELTTPQNLELFSTTWMRLGYKTEIFQAQLQDALESTKRFCSERLPSIR